MVILAVAATLALVGCEQADTDPEPEADEPSGSGEPEPPPASGQTTSEESAPPDGDDVAEHPSPESEDDPAARPDDASVDPAPRFFTLSTPSGRYELAVGDSATMELPPDTPQPATSGRAVLLIPVSSLAATGTKQWELRALQEGTTTIDVDTGSDEASWTIVVPG